MSLQVRDARTPTGRKLQLAVLLRSLREATEPWMTQQAAGDAVWPGQRTVQNRLALIEAGKRPIDAADLDALLKVYQVTDERVVEQAFRLQGGTSQRKRRWGGPRSVHSAAMRRYVDLEEDSQLIRCVSTELLPDQLQSPAYMRSELNACHGAASPEMEARLLRQQAVILREDDPPELYAVLSESCIRRVQANDPAIMREQLTHLLELIRRPHISIQLVPFYRPGLPPGTRSPAITQQGILERFVLLRMAVPGTQDGLPRYLDTAFTRMATEVVESNNVEHYETLWTRVLAAALPPAETRSFLEGALRDFS